MVVGLCKKTKLKSLIYQVKNQKYRYVFLRTKHTTVCPAFSTKTSTWSPLRGPRIALCTACRSTNSSPPCITNGGRQIILPPAFTTLQLLFILLHLSKHPVVLPLNVSSAKWSSFVTQWAISSWGYHCLPSVWVLQWLFYFVSLSKSDACYMVINDSKWLIEWIELVYVQYTLIIHVFNIWFF